METLKEIVTEHTLPQYDGSAIPELLRKMTALGRARPYKFEREAIEEAMTHLAADFVQDYFRSRIEARYKRLSPELFKLQREIDIANGETVIKKDERTTIEKIAEVADIPVLAWINYGASGWNHECKVDATIKREYEHAKSGKVPLKITVAAPPLIERVKKSATEAMAFAYEVCAAALRDERVIEAYNHLAVNETDSPEQTLHRTVNQRLEIIWKPTKESMTLTLDASPLERIIDEEERARRERDPALLLRFNDDRYLVTTWETHDEEPLKHYLAEFTQDVKQEKLKL